MSYAPDGEVLVTTSGTEALFAACQALLNPGDQCVVLLPAFPWYAPAVRLAGAEVVPVAMRAPVPGRAGDGFRPDLGELARALDGPRVRMLVVNSPHNPTGACLSRADAEAVAALCRAREGLWVVSDEVYDHAVFGGREHVHLSALEGMRERTVVVGSASKLLWVTGWRVGWALGPAAAIGAMQAVHGYVTFCAPVPLQEGVAGAIESGEAERYARETAAAFEGNAALLVGALGRMGLRGHPPGGGCFVVADVGASGMTDVEWCRAALEAAGVGCVPLSAFYAGAGEGTDVPRSLVRIAICKTRATVEEAAARLEAHRGGLGSRT